MEKEIVSADLWQQIKRYEQTVKKWILVENQKGIIFMKMFDFLFINDKSPANMR